MTLAKFIEKFKNVRTTALGLVSLATAAVFVADALLDGMPVNWEFVSTCVIVGLIGLNALDGGL